MSRGARSMAWVMTSVVLAGSAVVVALPPNPLDGSSSVKSGAAQKPQAQGQPGGVGIAFLPEGGRLKVAQLAPNGPAERAGVKEGDVLLEVDGQPAGDDAGTMSRVRGNAGTDVRLTFNRAGRRVELTIRREAMNLPPVNGGGGGGAVAGGGGGGAADAGQRTGGVGLNIDVDPNQGVVTVTGFARGSPAEAAGVRVGDRLVAIDGQAIRSVEDLSNRLPGAIGSEVKLTFLRDRQQVEFTMRRVARDAPVAGGGGGGGGNGPVAGGGGGGGGIGGGLGGLIGAGGGGANPQPPVNGGGGGGAAPAGQLPFLRVGLRLTYHAGESNIAGERLIKHPHGRIKDKKGDRWDYDTSSGQSGGVGYHQVNVIRADPEATVADARNYLILDQHSGKSSYRDSMAIVGSGEDMMGYWVHPARLAALREGQTDDGSVQRNVEQIGGRQVKTVTIRSGRAHYSTSKFDAQTGVLLSGGTTDANPTEVVVDEEGKIHAAGNGGMYSHKILMNARQVNIPWAGEPAPNWAKPGTRLNYQGMRTIRSGSDAALGQLPGKAGALWYSLDKDLGGGCVMGQTMIQFDIGSPIALQPQPSTLCFGSAVLGGLWIGPNAVKQMQPNQVIDEDPITKVRFTFLGVRQNLAMFVSQSPVDTIEVNYDMNSGIMAGVRLTSQPENFGQTVVQFQLVNNR